MAAERCVFCEIVAGRHHQEIVYSDDAVVAFLCEPPATLGSRSRRSASASRGHLDDTPRGSHCSNGRCPSSLPSGPRRPRRSWHQPETQQRQPSRARRFPLPSTCRSTLRRRYRPAGMRVGRAAVGASCGRRHRASSYRGTNPPRHRKALKRMARAPAPSPNARPTRALARPCSPGSPSRSPRPRPALRRPL